MQVEQVQITSLTQDPHNARKHGEKNLTAIKGSLKKFGQQKPIVVSDKNVVVAGNGTLAAAISLGWETIGIIRTGLAGAALKAFALADNRSSELAEWDQEELDAALKDLRMEDFDLGEIGFDESQTPPLNIDNQDPSPPSNQSFCCPKCGFKFEIAK